MTMSSHLLQRICSLRGGGGVAIILGLILSTLGALAAPLTLKELQFLLRQGTRESEILEQANSRRLVAPLDSAAIKSLKEHGASDWLIAKLSAPGIAIDANAAAAEARRRAADKARLDALVAEDAARKALRDRQWNENAELLRQAKTVQGWMRNKLYNLHKKEFKIVESKVIEPVSIFGLFHGSMGSSPSRDFAPKLAEAYARLKRQYGNEFEIIFISHDRDEYNQREFMRTFGLTCPTMRASTADPGVFQYGGETLPWFVLVADSGQALSLNGVNKQFIEPDRILAGLEQLLTSLHR
jgi:hypothetical protein